MKTNDRIIIASGEHWAREGELVSIEAGTARVRLSRPLPDGRVWVDVPATTVRAMSDDTYGT